MHIWNYYKGNAEWNKEVQYIIDKKVLFFRAKHYLSFIGFWKYLFISLDKRLCVIWNIKNQICVWFINLSFCFHSFDKFLRNRWRCPFGAFLLCFFFLIWLWKDLFVFHFLTFLNTWQRGELVTVAWERVVKDKEGCGVVDRKVTWIKSFVLFCYLLGGFTFTIWDTLKWNTWDVL